MDISEKIRNHNPWNCINCNHNYKNPEKEMEMIRIFFRKDKLYQEYRCKNCEAHIIVKCNVILDWNTTRTRVG